MARRFGVPWTGQRRFGAAGLLRTATRTRFPPAHPTRSPSCARAVFNVAAQGSAPLNVTRYTRVDSCAGQPPGSCVSCGSASYRTQALASTYKYGPLEEPIGMMYASFNATLTAATGFRTAWTFSDSRLTGWDPVARRWGSTTPLGIFRHPAANISINTYATPGSFDSGRLYSQELRSYYAFSSDADPEGERAEAGAQTGKAFRAFRTRR